MTLIERLCAATEGSRELDHAIAYDGAIGTEIEREVYEQHGAKWLTDDPKLRMSPLQKRHGCFYKYSRPGREGRHIRTSEQFVGIVTGPQPLRDCPRYTTSLDAALPGEQIRRVEKQFDGTWIAWDERTTRYGSVGHTEALARRIAALRADEAIKAREARG